MQRFLWVCFAGALGTGFRYGIGLWVGIELHPQAGGARRFCEALLQEGLLCKETHTHTIRLAPPLVITQEELDWAIGKLQKVMG